MLAAAMSLTAFVSSLGVIAQYIDTDDKADIVRLSNYITVNRV